MARNFAGFLADFWQGFKSFCKPNLWSLLALVAGATSVFGFAPFSFSPLAVLGLAVLFWLWTSKTQYRFQFAQYGFFYGLGLFGAGVSWLFSSIYFYSDTPFVLAVLLVAAFVMILSLFPMLAGLFASYFYRPTRSGYALILLLPASWVLLEFLRTKLLGGLPFLLSGISHLGTWLDGYAPVFGVLGVSFAVAMTAGLVVWFLVHKQTLPAALMLVFLWPIGGVLYKTQWVEADGEPIKVALLQGNVPQDIKWDQKHFTENMRNYVQMTRQSLDADLIVWPETAIPGFYDLAAKGLLKNFIADAKLQSKDILVGAITRDKGSDAYFNAMLNLKNDDEYRKRRLVMFGEYYPFAGLLEPLSEMLEIPFSQFSAGKKRDGIMELGGRPASVSICFEAMFGADLAQDLPAATYLVTTSNDAWFEHTFEPAQLLQEAQMRARELGREVARATNTGFTAIIDHKGQIKSQIEPYQIGVLRGEIQPYIGQTPFSRWQNFPILLIVLLVFFAPLATRYFLTGKFR